MDVFLVEVSEFDSLPTEYAKCFIYMFNMGFTTSMSCMIMLVVSQFEVICGRFGLFHVRRLSLSIIAV